mmetsp:Transcript_18873/g.28476  ORF Transcript_18873/g.28476 Transcript_18873/m.28476 type:complete len:272 (-) Transcript_18873:895-1710(-)
MGNVLFRQKQNELDIVNSVLSLRKRLRLKFVKIPTCLDELFEWIACATNMTNELDFVNFANIRPFIRKTIIKGEINNYEFIDQQSVDLPIGKNTDLSNFFETNVMLLMEIDFSVENDREKIKRNFPVSVSEFVRYCSLLRRYFELMDIRIAPQRIESLEKNSECLICMSRSEDIILPCLHSMCSMCARRWVGTSGDCPFCRQHYDNCKKFETNQWNIETVSQSSIEDDVSNLASKLKYFWCDRKLFEAEGVIDTWLPLDMSPSCALVIPLD